ncbi:DNA-binding transcriptional regulator [Thauera sp. 2A1]|uniref:helix-turn-helix domain-containing protein n=1 Tax=Thauera sp. 2A1 TaxID=2570191 RepID=UPI001290B7AF|nr:XRE family transcriptional regulator [Thauera sp. 2A1]KAI5915569.1 XRE family transcriptional regulator [Thauera sp. 2A1]
MSDSKTPTDKPQKQPTLRFRTGVEVQEHRKKLGLNQSEFWGRISVTQSGGSRYESGRNIPKPVQLLLHLTYGTEKQAQDLVTWMRPEKA